MAKRKSPATYHYFIKRRFTRLQESQVYIRQRSISGSSQSPDCSAPLTPDTAAAGDLPDKSGAARLREHIKPWSRATLTIKFTQRTGNINVPKARGSRAIQFHTPATSVIRHRKPAGAPTMAKTMRKHPGNLRYAHTAIPPRACLRPEPSGEKSNNASLLTRIIFLPRSPSCGYDGYRKAWAVHHHRRW